uniref:Troponin I, slow skeletal muscle-like n=1 Tax=Salmo trutta TaxID=8032 RepID=A0A673YG51_SALTR
MISDCNEPIIYLVCLISLFQKKTKYSATRRLLLKQKLLKKAGVLLVQEQSNKVTERESTLNERVPPLKLSGLSVQELQELCKELHRKCDTVDEARYDIEAKVLKNEKELVDLNAKINELKGGKRPNLKRVKKSADAMLGALTEAKLSSKSDFKSNLKTVKKDKKEEEKVDPGDWRKNVESMSGMEGRKKLFNS